MKKPCKILHLPTGTYLYNIIADKDCGISKYCRLYTQYELEQNEDFGDFSNIFESIVEAEAYIQHWVKRTNITRGSTLIFGPENKHTDLKWYHIVLIGVENEI